jgi:hypothetical protein
MDTSVIGKSLCNVIPRGNNVLVRMDFTVRLLAITSGKPDENDDQSKVRYSVAGFGPLVKDLKLGEIVIMSIDKVYDDIPVKENMRSIRELTKFYKDMDRLELNKLIGDKESSTVGVVQYGMFPEFIIKTHDANSDGTIKNINDK